MEKGVWSSLSRDMHPPEDYGSVFFSVPHQHSNKGPVTTVFKPRVLHLSTEKSLQHQQTHWTLKPHSYKGQSKRGKHI